MFDNFGSMRVGQSRALEVDPFTQQILWRYGEAEGQGFYSMSGGFIQRLPNGNTLIVSSNEGRAFEVTRGQGPRLGVPKPFPSGEKNELIATLEQVERLPADMNVEWARPVAGPLSVRLGAWSPGVPSSCSSWSGPLARSAPPRTR